MMLAGARIGPEPSESKGGADVKLAPPFPQELRRRVRSFEHACRFSFPPFTWVGQFLSPSKIAMHFKLERIGAKLTTGEVYAAALSRAFVCFFPVFMFALALVRLGVGAIYTSGVGMLSILLGAIGYFSVVMEPDAILNARAERALERAPRMLIDASMATDDLNVVERLARPKYGQVAYEARELLHREHHHLQGIGESIDEWAGSHPASTIGKMRKVTHGLRSGKRLDRKGIVHEAYEGLIGVFKRGTSTRIVQKMLGGFLITTGVVGVWIAMAILGANGPICLLGVVFTLLIVKWVDGWIYSRWRSVELVKETPVGLAGSPKSEVLSGRRWSVGWFLGLVVAAPVALFSPIAAFAVGIAVAVGTVLFLPSVLRRSEPEGITRTEALRELAIALRKYSYYLPRLGSYNAFGRDGLLSPGGYTGSLRPLFVRMWDYLEHGHTESEALAKLVEWTGLAEIEDDISNVGVAIAKSDTALIEQTAEVFERLATEEEEKQNRLSEVLTNRNAVAAFGLPMVLGIMPFIMALFVKLTGQISFLQGSILGWVSNENIATAAPGYARSFALSDVPVFWPIVGCALSVVLAAWFLSDRGKRLRNSIIGLGVFSIFMMILGTAMGAIEGMMV
jgi:hypothetical protein